MAVEDLARRNSVLRVEDIPVVYGLCANERKGGLTDPPPKLNVLLVAVCLQAFLGLEVEQLQCPALCLERDDGLSQVHNGTVGADWSSDDIIRVLEVDNNSLGGRIGFVVDLAHTNILVGLECLDVPLAFLLPWISCCRATYTVLP